jgi:hypothetical protein
MLKEQIILCFDCGTKNRIQKHLHGTAKCGHCGARLGAFASDDQRTPEHGSSEAGLKSAARSHRDPNGGELPKVTLFATAIFIGLVLAWLNYQRVSPSSTAPTQAVASGVPGTPAKTRAASSLPAAPRVAKAPEKAAAVASSQTLTSKRKKAPVATALQPVYQQPGLLFNQTGRPPLAPLEIVSAAGNDYFVKLVDLATGRDAVGIYVRGGRAEEVLIPLGSYEMRYAAGETWYGLRDLFGPKTAYSKANTTFNFTMDRGAYSGYTVELIRQVNGNLSTSTIGPEQF